jgi:3-oxoadipate enol-lactonase
MHIVDCGSGIPLVVVPSIQGRWEWVRPAVDALAASFRVITFSLCGERGCMRFDQTKGLDSFADQIAAVLDQRGIDRAAIAGISFGGLAALHFAARYPHRSSALVLVSTPGPTMHLKRRHELYTRYPWLFGPLFVAETPRRLRKEIAAAIPDRKARVRFAWGQVRTLLTAGLSFSRVAQRARLIGHSDIAGDCAAVTAPTLVISGDPSLDYVVSADGTSLYARLIRGARTVRLERTGHLGSITRPEAFAMIVHEFVETAERESLRSSARSSPRVSEAPQPWPEAESLRSRPRESEAVPARGGGTPRGSKDDAA